MAFGQNTTAATKMEETDFIVWLRKGFLRTTKEQIDIAQLHFLSLLTQTDCLIVLAPCSSPSGDFRLLSRENILSEKSTQALDKVPPAGPGCQAGRIRLDTTISHGNEHKADIHALNYVMLRSKQPPNRPQILV